MPSEAHEVLLVALREQPALLGTLVAKLAGVRLPRGLKPSDATVRFVKPAELKLDVLFRRGRRTWTIVEIQRGIDPKIPETPSGKKTRLFLEAQGRKRGRAEGLAEGEAKGKQEALLTLLRARGFRLLREDEARIRACTDAAKLDRWIERAVTAASVRAVLGTKSSAPPARRRAPGRSSARA